MSLKSFASLANNSKLITKWCNIRYTEYSQLNTAIIKCNKKQRNKASGSEAPVLGTCPQTRGKSTPRYMVPKLKYPKWYVPQFRVRYDEELTTDNAAFIKEIVHEKFGPPALINGLDRYLLSPLKTEPALRGEWFPGCRRAGLIAVKLGVNPQWTKDGKKFTTTLLQVVDNHVINYMPPGEFEVNRKKLPKRFKKENKMGCLLVGAISQDPQNFTKDYCGLFTKSGVMPKKVLTRFIIHPEAAIQPGTPLNAAHFSVGDAVDVTGKTIDRGFQGVMKRWGFHGMPATHGQTKTHRRPGNIGGGGEKGRVWPGTRLPGHMGNLTRTLKGLKIWRINHKYNVIYVVGQNVPGDVNSIVYIHDTILPLRRLNESPPFPTYYPEDHEESRPDEEIDGKLYDFNQPSIVFEEEKVVKKKR